MSKKQPFKMRLEYDWEGGHPAGCVNFSNGAWIVRFNDGTRKQFHEKFFGNEEAKRLAEEWRTKTSLEKDLTKNQYRRIEDDDEGIYYEMKLQNGHIAKFDEFSLPLATKCIWSAFKGTKTETYYMAHTGKKKAGIPRQSFHRLLCPLFKEVDHFNRNGLDNRIRNLRNGEGSINKLNQCKRSDNKSDKTGVHFCKYDNCWIVQYPYQGRRVKKRFSLHKYGNLAKDLAIAFRETIDIQQNIRNGYRPTEQGDDIPI
jgi:hypothetical protein